MATLQTWDPFRSLWDVKGDLDRLFSSRRGAVDEATSLAQWAPAVDIVEDTDEGFTQLAVELPGLAREDVKITVDDNTLSITGERKNTVREQKKGYTRIERAYGSFARSFTLPATIDTAHINAEMKNGVLYVRLPKSEQAKPRQIDVKVS